VCRAGRTETIIAQNPAEKRPVKNHTMLSRNSEELVMHELKGSYFSDWKPK
jgi:hypothetical protein